MLSPGSAIKPKIELTVNPAVILAVCMMVVLPPPPPPPPEAGGEGGLPLEVEIVNEELVELEAPRELFANKLKTATSLNE